MNALSDHLIVAPVVWPLVTAAVMLLLGDQQRRVKSVLNIASAVVGVVIAALIVQRVDVGPGAGALQVYLAGNWQAPFGIVLVADRLAAMMVLLVGVIGVGAALFAEARWVRVSVYFHPLFQIQLMGLNGAFLTGDLFNLFVFFEVMLAASYGLQLYGSGWARVRSGLHYITVNLLASSLFLVGLSVLYGVLGTLTMTDMAARMALIPASDRGLLHAGAAILAVAFLIKAGTWPLNAWLLPAYTAAAAPVAALFAVMTKVGVYALLRLSTLFFSDAAGPSAGFGDTVLITAGLVTIAVGCIALLASPRLGHLVSASVIVSAGILLAAFGIGSPALTAAALYYLLSGTLAVSALFLLVEEIEGISARHDPLDGGSDPDRPWSDDTNLDDEERPLVGRVIPISTALIALAYLVCAMIVAGLPPLSGFIAKLAMLTALVGADGAATVGTVGWIFGALLLLSGLITMVVLTRAGIRRFWSSGTGVANVRRVEALAVVTLLACCLALVGWAEPVLRYTTAIAAGLDDPGPTIEQVLSTQPIDRATRGGTP